jgi:hypothetical protein
MAYPAQLPVQVPHRNVASSASHLTNRELELNMTCVCINAAVDSNTYTLCSELLRSYPVTAQRPHVDEQCCTYAVNSRLCTAGFCVALLIEH